MAAAPATRRLFVLGEALGACVRRDRATLVGTANRRAWYLVDAGAVVPGCDPRAADAQAGADAPRDAAG
jgi:hypothetical protein